MEQLVIIMLFITFTLVTTSKYDLSAVISSPYVARLYRQIKTEGGQVPFSIPSGKHLSAVWLSYYAANAFKYLGGHEPPSGSDLTISADIRKRICRSITKSDYFQVWESTSVNVTDDEVYQELKERKYEDLFEKIYLKSPDNNWFFQTKYDYVNPYRTVDVHLHDIVEEEIVTTVVKEQVLLCLARKQFAPDLIPYYVSKEYNVNRLPSFYTAGRFVFKSHLGCELMALAEEPTTAYVSPDFDIEFYYRWIRKYNQPTEKENEDPLCQLILSSKVDNQYSRICMKALTSSYFRGKLKYVHNAQGKNKCHYQEVSFQRNIHHSEEISIEKYYEWMLLCKATDIMLGTDVNFYVSRAYNTDCIFIYKLWKEEESVKVYLENLSTNFGIEDNPTVHSRTNFVPTS